MIISFTVDVTPVPQSRPRVTRRHVYEEPRVAEYKQHISTIAKLNMKGRLPITEPVFVGINIRRNKKSHSRAFGDIDNHIKAILDALNGICYNDDSQIVKLTVYKVQAANEGIDICITNMEDF